MLTLRRCDEEVDIVTNIEPADIDYEDFDEEEDDDPTRAAGEKAIDKALENVREDFEEELAPLRK